MNMLIQKIHTATLLAAAWCISLVAQEKSVDLQRSDRSDYIWVAAHRGDWIYAPENSMEALEHAVHFGARLLETDVRLTKDGHIVILD